jgi:hypothetical protein
MRSLEEITTFQEAISNIAAMGLLQSELSLMGEPFSDENLIEIHSSKLSNLDCFKPLKKQFLLSDHHLRLASPPNVKKALLPTKPPVPTHTWQSYCIEVEGWHRLEAPAVSSLMSRDTESPTVLKANSATETTKSGSLTAESVLHQVLDLLKTTLSPPKAASQSPYRLKRGDENRDRWSRMNEESRQSGHQRNQGRDSGRGHGRDREQRSARQETTRRDWDRDRRHRHDDDRRNGVKPKTDNDRNDRGRRANSAVADGDEESYERESQDEDEDREYVKHQDDDDYVAMSARGHLKRSYSGSDEDNR